MTHARFNLNEYSIRVLDVIKGKYGLKNRNEALNKFIEKFGEEFVQPKINEEILFELDNIVLEHEKKYGIRRKSKKDLDKLFE